MTALRTSTIPPQFKVMTVVGLPFLATAISRFPTALPRQFDRREALGDGFRD